MDDKDVGKLWVATLESDSGVMVRADVFRDLIRKLVEERAWRLRIPLSAAAKQFGIDTWIGEE
jgi:metal-responsive CopG/Arc/MetJ family transcriptional regulator